MATGTAEEPQLQMDVDDFSALEQRVLRAVEVVRTERAARAEAEEAAARSQREVEEKSAQLEQAQVQLQTMEREREQVRQRVERLLKQMDEITS